jgi:hypothetical protein
MKIAVCISGGIRYPHFGLKSIQKIIPNEYVKIFIHTWKIEDIISFLKTIHGLEYKEIEKLCEIDLSFLENYDYEKLLIEKYDTCQEKFKKLFNSLKFFPNSDSINARNDIGPISMHYSIFKANQLKKEYEEENNIKFDWVIRMRTDSDFKYDVLDLNSFNHDLNIPSGEDWSDNAINDQFAIGRSDAMDLYSNLYNSIHNVQTTEYFSEKLLFTHLNNVNLTSNRINFPVRINNYRDYRRIWYPHLLE